jgi:outer membrane protein OmpA-like peptidoglycan-associated protein
MRLRHAAPLAFLAAALTLTPSRTAQADDEPLRSRFAIHLEGGAGYMLPEFQRTQLGYGLAIEGAARVGISFVDLLALQLSVSQYAYPINGTSPAGQTGFGGALPVTGGLRLEPMVGRIGRFFVDANAGVVFSGHDPLLIRFGFDAGLGFEFAATRWFGIGLFGRYAHVLHAADDEPSDSMTVVGGLSIALRYSTGGTHREEHREIVANPPPPPPDTDRDGVLDRDDLCVNEPAGAHPDPQRRGCPLTDTDHDEVFDNQDQCVTTPAGPHPDPERRGCPDADTDNDMVLDHDDQCRTEHAGIHPDPARPGCPLPDRDHDTIPDPTDHCPDQFGAPNPNPNRNGCPGLVRVEDGQIRILTPVFFATNRDRILPRSFPVLTAVADALRATPEMRRVAVEGHTDDVGDDARNLALSDRRAASVMQYLVQHGVDATRLESHGYGETRPVLPNTSRANRAANRRVEFRIVDPPQPAGDTTASGAMTPPPTPTPAASAAPVPAAPAAPARPARRRHGRRRH